MAKCLRVMKTKCPTCPFRTESKYADLAPDLARSALTEAGRICHSTGSNNAINRRTGVPAALCRGARDLQLQFFAGQGFIKAETDEAWNEKCLEMGLPELKIIELPKKDIKCKKK